MARASFGGGVADFVVSGSAGGSIHFAAATLTMWSAETGGTPYNDLRLNGAPVTAIPVLDDGQIPTFQGPDEVLVMWASAGGGPRVMIDASGDIAVRAGEAADRAEAAAETASTLPAWARDPDLLVAGEITRNANGIATSAAVIWPDGTPGTYTADTLSTVFPGATDGYHITYGSPPTKTFTQPTITRNSDGSPSDVPEIEVS